MSTLKAALKSAKSAIDARKYPTAIEEANKVLSLDGNNYHAHVFLGVAEEKQDHLDAAEASYLAATSLKENEVLAWQGLVSLYEKQHGKKLDQWHDVALRLAQIYMHEDDRVKCQAVIDKYTLDAQKYGSRTQYKQSLSVLLPSSPIYDYLEGRIPHPGATFIKVADICETEQKERINSEIGKRRTRLGARLDQVTTEVRREVLEHSPLENLYQNIIDWTLEDTTRREYEEKLLRHAGEQLAVLPLPKKAQKRQQVQKLANGLVILKHPFILAWRIELEWSDVENLEQLDFNLLTDFISLFPEEGLSKVMKGFIGSDASPFQNGTRRLDESADTEEDIEPMRDEERLILMTEGLEESSSSILSHRIISQYYLHLEEYESAVKTSRDGLRRVASESYISGLGFENSTSALKLALATGLVHFQAPRHHPEARSLFEEILTRKSTDASALMGIGLIYEEQENYAEAFDNLVRALRINNSPRIRAEAAWCKALNGDTASGLRELEACLAELEDPDSRTKSLRSQVLYRIGMCIWSKDASNKARKDRGGAYSYFLASLQADLNYAPAYTSLGIYYADYARDRKRAIKCFLKAFELSVSELQAAEHLARMLAKSGNWDEVEAVALRVVNSGKYKSAPGSKKKSLSWPFAALGVVELNNQEYAKSIVSFQSALRISPEDYHSWIGLGESYHNSGRYIAATRAFEHAEGIQVNSGNSNDTWFSKYMLANVKRELGEYEDAIARYEAILDVRDGTFGVSIALLQCLVESAWHSIESGLFGRATELATKAIKTAFEIGNSHGDSFNLWKAAGDACAVFRQVPAYANHFPLSLMCSLLGNNIDPSLFDTVGNWDHIGQQSWKELSEQQDNTSPNPVFSMLAAILAHKRAVLSSMKDIHIRAVAWYNLGWTEYLAHSSEVTTRSIQADDQDSDFLQAAVQCFKRAIEFEAGNAEFWNALGVCTQDLSPKVAQHSFIRSLYLNEKDPRTWTNLGGFYLRQGDLQLANEAFTKGQSADPDYAEAWLGQGLLAARLANHKEAWSLFTHAFEIANSSQLIKQEYALSIFDGFFSTRLSGTILEVLQPLFALRQLSIQASNTSPFEHLKAMFAERADDTGDAKLTLEFLCSELEKQYEAAETHHSLVQFAQSKSDLARVELAGGAFDSAAENAEMALDLSTNFENEGDFTKRLRLSAHMTSGLAYYYKDSMDEAIHMFKQLLNETEGDPDVICLLSQVLWAKGGSEECAIAREQLFECIENHPGHAAATILLGAIAVLDEDQDTLDAVIEDLENLQTKDNISSQQRIQVTELLKSISATQPIAQDDLASGSSRAMAAIMLNPSQPEGWSQLSALSEASFPADVGVLTAMKTVPPDGDHEATDLCKILSETNKLGDAQKAVMYAPWSTKGWEALG